jgi:GNAT superfamily N-acetyltransferase
MTHLVYRLMPIEYNRYRPHLLALDEYSRYLRFGYQISDEMINKLCDKFEANPKQHKLFVIENDNLDVVAVGHVSLEGAELELAFSVLKQYQGQGMGSALMARTVEWCQNRGIKGGCMVCLSSNAAIKKLAAKHGILVNDGGETLADIKIPDATAISMAHEVATSNIARFDHLGKLQRHFAKMITFPLLFR